ncbi:hypothetical protein ABZ498_06640 [Streptomyces lavendulocolor]|uniref:hypothetical protein n=1 Tax=Streptomyces lavendulocolor TaxID=67316 RepID=UPI0033CF84FE
MARLQPTARPVRRAQDFYTPPPQLPADCWNTLPPAERVIAYIEQVQQRRLPRPEAELPGPPLIARVDAGRWVAQCPQCASAQVVTPDDPRMWCVECQPDGWATVRFPEDPASVETEVAALPSRERFWWAEDDPAWNRPRRRRPRTAKTQAVAAHQDSIPPPPPDATPPLDPKPPTDGGVPGAPGNATHVGGR